jgi:uncharacterized protein YjbI with pentapeptide repeats
MTESYFYDQTFERKDNSENELKKGEYENCTFRCLSLAGVDLSVFFFIDCKFVDCDLSLTKLQKTVLRDVAFCDCKMLGLRFDECHQAGLSFRFQNCQLQHSVFYSCKIKKTIFRNSNLQECDFSECDLQNAVFEQCDLSGAVFENTNLIQADFSTAMHYCIDPESNKIKKARFSMYGLAGLLSKYNIVIDEQSV